MSDEAGQFYLRPEWDDWDLIDEMAADPPFRAGVISAKYLVEKPDSNPSPLGPERLRERFTENELDWFLDPGTAPLARKNVMRAFKGKRDINTPFAKALELPLSAERLAADGGAAEALVDAGIPLQLTSRVRAAPYLRTGGLHSVEHEANRALVRLTKERSGDRRVVAFVEASMNLVRNGDALRIALDLLEDGASFAVFRIYAFDPQCAEPSEVLAYMKLVEGIGTAGGFPVPDCVGRLGPLFISAGAHAFCSGAIYFRKVAGSETPSSGAVPRPFYDLPGLLYALTRDSLHTEMPACDHLPCPANDGQGSLAGLKIHNTHELEGLAALAARGELERLLRSSPAHYARRWAEALAAFESGEEELTA